MTRTRSNQQPNGTPSETTPLFEPISEQPPSENKHWYQQALTTTWLVLRSNYANVLLIFVPLGIIFGALGKDPITVFILNFLAIIPLAALLSFATEELSAHLGQTIGGLMNATFGNAVELIVSIIALRENQIRIVQSSMLGSILSNILLVSLHAGKSMRHSNTFRSLVVALLPVESVAITLNSTPQSRLQCRR